VLVLGETTAALTVRWLHFRGQETTNEAGQCELSVCVCVCEMVLTVVDFVPVVLNKGLARRETCNNVRQSYIVGQ
jgi:hypothetical protein